MLGVPARTFTIWQIAEGLAWSPGVTLAGYALASHIWNVDRYLLLSQDLGWLEASVAGLRQRVGELFLVSSLGHGVFMPAAIGGS